jgi:hypothetical protein
MVGSATPLGKRLVPVPICCKVNGAVVDTIVVLVVPLDVALYADSQTVRTIGTGLPACQSMGTAVRLT